MSIKSQSQLPESSLGDPRRSSLAPWGNVIAAKAGYTPLAKVDTLRRRWL